MNKGIILAGLALATSSLWAADWNFYGSVRLSTFGEALIDTGDADTEFSNYYRLQPNSRIGANVKDGAIGATFEAYLDHSGEVVSSTSWMGFAAVQVPIGAYVAPEAGTDKQGEDYDNATLLYYGAKSQINF